MKKRRLSILNEQTVVVKNEKIDRHFEQGKQKLLQDVVERAGIDSKMGLPKKNQPLQAFKDPIISFCKNLYQFGRKELQADEQQYFNETDKQYVDDKKAKNQKEIDENDYEKSQATIEFKRLPTINMKIKPFVHICLAIAALCLAVYDAKSFMYGLQENLALSFMMGLTVSGIMAMWAKTLPTYMEKYCLKKWQKIAAFVGSILIIGTVAFLLGKFRTDAQVGYDGLGTSSGTNPLVFAFINLFVFTGEFLAVLVLLPSSIEEEQYLKKEALKEQIDSLDARITELNEENNDLDEEYAKLVKVRKANAIYESNLKDWAQGIYEEAWGKYLSEVTLRRRDDYTPVDLEPTQLFNTTTK